MSTKTNKLAFPSNTSFAWAYLIGVSYIAKFLSLNTREISVLFSDLLGIIAPLLMLVAGIQIVVNTIRLIKDKPKLNLTKIIINLLLFFLLGFISNFIKS